jgi:AraC-like DNA-binding protein
MSADSTPSGTGQNPANPSEPQGKPRARMGRPPRAREAFKQDVFEALLAVRATEDDVLTEFRISESTLKRCIKQTYGRHATFDTLSKLFKGRTKLSLRRRVLAKAFYEKNGKYDSAMIRYAHQRFDDMPMVLQLQDDPDQHADRMAIQSAAASITVKTQEREAVRVDRLLELLAAATKNTRRT